MAEPDSPAGSRDRPGEPATPGQATTPAYAVPAVPATEPPAPDRGTQAPRAAGRVDPEPAPATSAISEPESAERTHPELEPTAAAESEPATVTRVPAETEPTTRPAPETRRQTEPAPTAVLAPSEQPARAGAAEQPAPPPPAPAALPVLQPAEPEHRAPKQGSNRLAGTAWVLLAAGLFQVGYVLMLSLLVAVFNGPGSVLPQLGYLSRTPLAWLPVLFFLLFSLLTALLLNRAGRFAWVIGSLVVAVLTYGVSVLLIPLMAGGSIGDAATLSRALLDPEFVVIGLVAREVLLWTGFAIGARGTRVRNRNRAARDAYRQQVAERSDARA